VQEALEERKKEGRKRCMTEKERTRENCIVELLSRSGRSARKPVERKFAL